MTRNEQKLLYNKEHYTQVKVSIKPDEAKAFKEECAKNGHAQAFVLGIAMAKYVLRSKYIRDYSVKFLDELSNDFSGQQLHLLEYSNALSEKIEKLKAPAPLSYDTLPKRRKAASAILGQLDELLSAENDYVNNQPENLLNSERVDDANERIDKLEDIMKQLNDVYFD